MFGNSAEHNWFSTLVCRGLGPHKDNCIFKRHFHSGHTIYVIASAHIQVLLFSFTDIAQWGTRSDLKHRVFCGLTVTFFLSIINDVFLTSYWCSQSLQRSSDSEGKILNSKCHFHTKIPTVVNFIFVTLWSASFKRQSIHETHFNDIISHCVLKNWMCCIDKRENCQKTEVGSLDISETLYKAEKARHTLLNKGRKSEANSNFFHDTFPLPLSRYSSK